MAQTQDTTNDVSDDDVEMVQDPPEIPRLKIDSKNENINKKKYGYDEKKKDDDAFDDTASIDSLVPDFLKYGNNAKKKDDGTFGDNAFDDAASIDSLVPDFIR